MKKIHLIIIAIILLFIGSRFYMDFLYYLISNNGNIQIVSTKLSSQFFESIYFGLSLAIIPILIMFSWRFVTNKKMSSIFIVGFSLFGFLIDLRNLKLTLSFQLNDYKQAIAIENINFSTYLFFSSLIGLIFSILIFKKPTPQS